MDDLLIESVNFTENKLYGRKYESQHFFKHLNKIWGE